MEQNRALKQYEVYEEEGIEETRLRLEEAADRLLSDPGASRVRVYSDRALARKMRLEQKRLPEVDETALPDEAANYLLRRHIELLIGSARLSRFQGAVLTLAIQGWSPIDISHEFRISLHTVRRVLRVARRKLAKRQSPYEGLYEVYWREVNRYVYRKSRTPTR